MTVAVFGVRSISFRIASLVFPFALCARLEELAKCDEREDHRRGFKIEIHLIFVHQMHILDTKSVSDLIDSKNPINDRCSRAKSDQGIHIWRAAPEIPESVFKIGKVHINNRHHQQKLGECKRELRKGQGNGVGRAMEKARQRQAHHMSHGDIK